VTIDPRLTKVGLAAGGLVAGVVLAGTVAAQAASTPNPAPSAGASTTAEDPHPGDNGADGVPEAQEHHVGGHGHGHGLQLTGTVTAVDTTASTVSIQTANGTATTAYSVTSNSDIDKNGEGQLSDLKPGDAVTFSVDSGNAKQIDKLHAGDETKNMPQRSTTTPPTSTGTPSA
jgi:hypothetical protein